MEKEILFGGFVRFVFFFLLLNVNVGIRMWGEDAKKWENVMEFAIFLLYFLYKSSPLQAI